MSKAPSAENAIHDRGKQSFCSNCSWRANIVALCFASRLAIAHTMAHMRMQQNTATSKQTDWLAADEATRCDAPVVDTRTPPYTQACENLKNDKKLHNNNFIRSWGRSSGQRNWAHWGRCHCQLTNMCVCLYCLHRRATIIKLRTSAAVAVCALWWGEVCATRVTSIEVQRSIALASRMRKLWRTNGTQFYAALCDSSELWLLAHYYYIANAKAPPHAHTNKTTTTNEKKCITLTTIETKCKRKLL